MFVPEVDLCGGAGIADFVRLRAHALVVQEAEDLVLGRQQATITPWRTISTSTRTARTLFQRCGNRLRRHVRPADIIGEIDHAAGMDEADHQRLEDRGKR